jgi:hypothetical protein
MREHLFAGIEPRKNGRKLCHPKLEHESLGWEAVRYTICTV